MRPTKYKKEYCQKAVDMGTEGKTFVQIACAIGVHVDTLNEWCRVHPEFSDAFKIAKQLSESYWTERAQEASLTGGSYGLMKFYLSARFGWSEKTEVKNDITSQGEKLASIPVIIQGCDVDESASS